MITCTKCNVKKPLSNFRKDSTRLYGVRKTCKDCVKRRIDALPENRKKKISSDKSDYNKNYYQRNKKEIKENVRTYRLSGHGLFIDIITKNKNAQYEFTEVEFLTWYDKQKKVCSYCGCELKRVNDYLSRTKREFFMRRFEIDKIKPSHGYKISNIVLSCCICNFHKKDYFSFSEFKSIAKKYIRTKVMRDSYKENC